MSWPTSPARLQVFSSALLTAVLLLALLIATPDAEAQFDPEIWVDVTQPIEGDNDGDLAGPTSFNADGSVIIVGLPGHNAGEGKVRVLRRTAGSTWQPVGGNELLPPPSSIRARFGTSVAIDDDGDTIIVGYLGPSRGNPGLHEVAQVYRLEFGTWRRIGDPVTTAVAKVPFDTVATVDISGDGSRIVVGIGRTETQVVAYRLVGETLQPLGQPLTLPADEPFGTAALVAMNRNGDRLIASDEGGTRVYALPLLTNEWQQINGDLPPASSVAISDTGGIVTLGMANQNLARVYRDVGGSWLTGANLVGEAAGDQAGATVAMNSSGSVIAVGAPGGGPNAGSVRIYRLSGALWRHAAQDIDGVAAGDASGRRGLALNAAGTQIAIGAWLNDDGGENAGHVRVLRRGFDTSRFERDLEVAGDPPPVGRGGIR